MSLLRSSFSVRRAKPRQAGSRFASKFSAEELSREFGPQCRAIDARIGDQTMIYDIAQAEWTADGVMGRTPSNSREVAMLERTKYKLVEENDKLREKVDLLLEMLAEVTAEMDARRNR